MEGQLIGMGVEIGRNEKKTGVRTEKMDYGPGGMQEEGK